MRRNAIAPEILDLMEVGSPGDIDCYTQYARHHGGPLLVVLCGTGRYVAPLARLNLPVMGLERDAGLLELARRKAVEAGAGRAVFSHAEPARFASEQRFPLVIVPGGALQRLLSLEEQKAALAAIRRSMAPGGRLLLDLPVLDPGLFPVLEPPVLRRAPGSERSALLRISRSVDTVRQLVETLVECQWVGPAGEVEASTIGSHIQRYSTPGEVQLLLEVSGFSCTLYGDWDRRPFEPGAVRMLVEAERR